MLGLTRDGQASHLGRSDNERRRSCCGNRNKLYHRECANVVLSTRKRTLAEFLFCIQSNIVLFKPDQIQSCISFCVGIIPYMQNVLCKTQHQLILHR